MCLYLCIIYPYLWLCIHVHIYIHRMWDVIKIILFIPESIREASRAAFIHADTTELKACAGKTTACRKYSTAKLYFLTPMYINGYVYMSVCIYVCIHMCTYICIYIFIYKYRYIYIYLFIYAGNTPPLSCIS
jgi:hypothetical protein